MALSHSHVRWWRSNDTWSPRKNADGVLASFEELLEMRRLREVVYREVVPRPPEAKPYSGPANGLTTDRDWVEQRRAVRRAQIEAQVKARVDSAERQASELIQQEEEVV